MFLVVLVMWFFNVGWMVLLCGLLRVGLCVVVEEVV